MMPLKSKLKRKAKQTCRGPKEAAHELIGQRVNGVCGNVFVLPLGKHVLFH